MRMVAIGSAPHVLSHGRLGGFAWPARGMVWLAACARHRFAWHEKGIMGRWNSWNSCLLIGEDEFFLRAGLCGWGLRRMWGWLAPHIKKHESPSRVFNADYSNVLFVGSRRSTEGIMHVGQKDGTSIRTRFAPWGWSLHFHQQATIPALPWRHIMYSWKSVVKQPQPCRLKGIPSCIKRSFLETEASGHTLRNAHLQSPGRAPRIQQAVSLLVWLAAGTCFVWHCWCFFTNQKVSFVLSIHKRLGQEGRCAELSITTHVPFPTMHQKGRHLRYKFSPLTLTREYWVLPLCWVRNHACSGVWCQRASSSVLVDSDEE